MKTKISSHGGRCTSSVVANTDYLISNALGSSKTQIAVDKGIPHFHYLQAQPVYLVFLLPGVPIANEEWLDDCIAQDTLLATADYFLANPPATAKRAKKPKTAAKKPLLAPRKAAAAAKAKKAAAKAASSNEVFDGVYLLNH
jgi:hypothetical protein